MGLADLGKVVGDFIQNSPQLIAAIALMGGAGGAMKARQESSSGAEQTQTEAPEDGKPVDQTNPPPSSEPSIPDSTTSNNIPTFEAAFASSQTIEKLKAQPPP